MHTGSQLCLPAWKTVLAPKTDNGPFSSPSSKIGLVAKHKIPEDKHLPSCNGLLLPAPLHEKPLFPPWILHCCQGLGDFYCYLQAAEKGRYVPPMVFFNPTPSGVSLHGTRWFRPHRMVGVLASSSQNRVVPASQECSFPGPLYDEMAMKVFDPSFGM